MLIILFKDQRIGDFFCTGEALVARVIPCETCVANTNTQTTFLYSETFMKITKITPWLLLATAAYNFGRQGEYIFVEVQTDEGITGWGEITTTYPAANRAVCAVLQQLEPMLQGDDPLYIEMIWNKIFRRFTYMGSRGATTLSLIHI